MTNYAGNSHKAKEEAAKQEERKPVEKVVKGGVKKQKQSGFKNVVGAIVSEEARGIKEHVIYSIIIPVIQDTVSQIVKDSIDIIFKGETKGNRGYGYGGGGRSASKVSYGAYYDEKRDGRRDMNRHDRRYSYDDLTFEYREDAENVLDRMYEILEEYGVVRVSDLFDVSDVTGNGPTDQNYGWTSLRNSCVERTRHNEYIIRLPRAAAIRR